MIDSSHEVQVSPTPARLVAAGHITGRRILRVSFDRWMPSDDYLQARHREDTWHVPTHERRTCAQHNDWRTECAPLHKEAA